MGGQPDHLDFGLSEAMKTLNVGGSIWVTMAFNMDFMKMMKKNQTC